MKTTTSKIVRGAIHSSIALAAVFLVVYFFRAQFIKNWNGLRGVRLDPHIPLLALSLICIALSYLIMTAMWRRAANRLASGRPFSFTQSIGMVNTSQLTKYIPGKVWGYAMQMALVDRNSLPIPAVLYVNLLLALTNSFIALIVGGMYLCVSSALMPRSLAIAATSASFVLYVFFLLFNGRFFSILLGISQRVFRRTITAYDLGLPEMLRQQAMGVAASIVLGISALMCCRGLGFSVSLPVAWSVCAGFLFADTIGFLAFFVPGGIGVREGLFFILLNEYGAGPLALILPIAMRLISMIVDASLGLLGIIYLRKYVKDKA
jgi:hypothetical protein